MACKVGKPYLDKSNGYMIVPVTIDGRKTTRKLHRMIWEEVNGQIPEGFHVDHIDGDRLNNTLSNLRLATNQQNSSNRAIGELTNIDVRSGKYRVKICYFGVTHYFGTYDSLELAQLVRDEARTKLNGEFYGRTDGRA